MLSSPTQYRMLIQPSIVTHCGEMMIKVPIPGFDKYILLNMPSPINVYPCQSVSQWCFGDLRLETWLMWLWLLKVSLQNLMMLSPLLILRRVFTIGWWQLTAWQQLGMFGNNLSTAFQLSPTLSNIFRQNFGIACCGLFVSWLGRSRALNPWICCAFGIVPL